VTAASINVSCKHGQQQQLLVILQRNLSIWQLGGGGISITEVGDEGGGAGKHGGGEDGETRSRGGGEREDDRCDNCDDGTTRLPHYDSGG
jgi:hypothetical protein